MSAAATAAEVATPSPETGAALLARIKPQKRRERTSLCLRPDLVQAWETANEELQRLRVEEVSSGRLATGVSPAVKKKAREVQKLEAEIEETQVWFTVEAMSKDEWEALAGVHPPRKDNQIDQIVGHNRDAVMAEAVLVCVVEPVFDDASWNELLTVLSPSEWDELKTVTNMVNGKVVDAPKSVLAESLLRGTPSTASRRRNSGG